jgi:hypothetical protein
MGFLDIETWHGAFPVFLVWRPASSASAAAADANSSWPVAADGLGNSAASQQQDLAAAATVQTDVRRPVESETPRTQCGRAPINM